MFAPEKRQVSARGRERERERERDVLSVTLCQNPGKQVTSWLLHDKCGLRFRYSSQYPL